MSIVYFVQSGPGGPIKVGTTVHSMKRRLHGLQSGNPVEISVLATIPGDEKLERRLHKAIFRERVRLEWFACSDVTLALVRSVQAGLAVEECLRRVERIYEIRAAADELRRISISKHRYRAHRRDPRFGQHYRAECSVLLVELEQKRARLQDRARRVAAKARAVAA